jgi:hypothetical protein
VDQVQHGLIASLTKGSLQINFNVIERRLEIRRGNVCSRHQGIPAKADMKPSRGALYAYRSIYMALFCAEFRGPLRYALRPAIRPEE